MQHGILKRSIYKAKVKDSHSRSGRALACNRQFRFIYHLFEWSSDLLNPLGILSLLPNDDKMFDFLEHWKYIHNKIHTFNINIFSWH